MKKRRELITGSGSGSGGGGGSGSGSGGVVVTRSSSLRAEEKKAFECESVECGMFSVDKSDVGGV